MNERLYPAAVHRYSFSHSLRFSPFPPLFSRCLFSFTFFVTCTSLCCPSAKFSSAERRRRRQMFLFLRVTIAEWRFQAAALLLLSACLFCFSLIFSVFMCFCCDFSSEELWHIFYTSHLETCRCMMADSLQLLSYKVCSESIQLSNWIYSLNGNLKCISLLCKQSKTQITALQSARIAAQHPEIVSS